MTTIPSELKIGLLGLVALSTSGCSFGPMEMLIILAIVVLLFGATRLPALGKALGETVKSFRNSSGVDSLDEGNKDDKAVVTIEDAKVEPAHKDEDKS